MGFLGPKPSTSSSVTNSNSASNSYSGNYNNGAISNAYAPQINNGVGANNILASLLSGTGDMAGAQRGYNAYLDNAGYQNALSKLQQGITGGAAASGLLNSGSTQKALASQGAALNQQYFNNYLQQLSGLSGQGLNAGQLVGNVGNFSNSNSNSNSVTNQNSRGGQQSLFGEIGTLAGAFLSDRRLKTDIEKVDTFPDGLGVYHFRYKGRPEKFKGVMADEVAQLRPWALGPEIEGYQTVEYGAL